MGDSVDCGVEGGVSFESKNKMNISPLMVPSKEELSVDCSDKAMNLTENTSVIS